MTAENLQLVSKLVKTAMNDCEYASSDELLELEAAVHADWYKASVREFKEYLDKAMPRSTAPEDAQQNFTNTPWYIAFGNTGIALDNTATVYNFIMDMLSELLDNEL